VAVEGPFLQETGRKKVKNKQKTNKRHIGTSLMMNSFYFSGKVQVFSLSGHYFSYRAKICLKITLT
jgi:hypothetical protein